MPARKPAADPCAEIASRVAANPFGFITFAEAALLFGFGVNSMTTLSALGAPVVFRRVNPKLLLSWLAQHHEKVKGLV